MNQTEIQYLMESLSKTPFLLARMLEEIPKEKLKIRRKPGKWSIHENACHLAQAEKMIQDRFDYFSKEPNPVFHPYLPGETVSDQDLITMDINDELDSFAKLRTRTIEILETYEPALWDRSGSHPQYYEYTPKILLRHTVMHDHFHMYRIEELWLTTPDYL